ncbi:MAG: hypothetical protein RIR55_1107 [Bacteroidota bacterium]
MILILIPIMSAILGWFIAWLFIKILFAPWNNSLKNFIQNLQIETIVPASSSKAQIEAILPLIDEKFDQFFKHKIGEKMPMISMFIGDKTVAQLKSIFLEELQLIFPDVLNQFLNNAKDDFSKNISSKWRLILEPILLKATKKYRFIAFTIGLIWGIITLLLIHLL